MNIVFAIPGFSTDRSSAEGKLVRKTISQCANQVGSVKLLPSAAVFGIDEAFRPRTSDRTNAVALEALLRCLTNLDLIWLRFHPATPGLYDSGVYYARTLVWDTIPAMYRRGFGDCKSLAACRVAELFRSGIWCRPVFRFKSRPNMTMYHILLMFADGAWECPSRILGMETYQENPEAQGMMHRTRAGFGLRLQ